VVSIVQEAGLSIPGDISIMGFGNEPSGNCAVSLTTFDQHPLKIGAAAAQMYLDRVNGDASNGIQRKLIAPDLVARASTRPLN
jgi:DNA-binding LacI/PurR family transcriptional regulator